MKRHSNSRAVRKAPRGFTLVELLVVIGILVILITMLTPTVSAVRTMGKVTATSVLLHTLDTGLNMFKGEIRLGRDYPPSFYGTGPAPYPYTGDLDAYGAQTIVWALLGSDLQGTAGFRGDLSVLYDPKTIPKPARYGPFVDSGKVKLMAPGNLISSDALNANPNVPVFADSFEMPVLYFKADNGLYDWGHNGDFLQGSPTPAWTHLFNPGIFANYTQDKRAPGNIFIYQNRDSFLLISPGPDKVYGTGDDVTNFTPHQQ